MAFRTNSSQQYSFTDKVFNLTPREQKALENSWAKVFADEIFPSIDEERFRVLYSDRTKCRSNTPVNVIVGALIIKEMFQLSDDEVVENLMLDPRYQYALLTTSFALMTPISWWTSAVRILTASLNTSFWSDASLNRPSLKTVRIGSEKKQMAE